VERSLPILDAPVLSDGVVTLRPWRPDDAQAVFKACQDPLIALHTYVPVPYTIEHAQGFIAHCTEALTNGSTAAGFAITPFLPPTIPCCVCFTRPCVHRSHRNRM